MVQRTRSLAATAILIAICFGVPALLVLVARWPLPTTWPDWGTVRIAIQQGDVPGEVVVNTIAVVVWLAWIQLMWALAWELAVNVRAVERGRVARPTPLAPKSTSALVTRLVAFAFSLGATTISTASTAFATFPTVAVVAPYGPHVALAHTSPSGWASAVLEGGSGSVDSDVAAGPRWCVAPGDSMWSIAEVALGDGSRVTEILELNRSIRSPRELQPGHVLDLPTDAVVPADRVHAATPVASVPATRERAVYAPAETVEVVRGDNLWNLADARLERVTGTPPDGADVLDYVNAVVAANSEAIDDPNLIFPGQRFVFPAIGTPPPESHGDGSGEPGERDAEQGQSTETPVDSTVVQPTPLPEPESELETTAAPPLSTPASPPQGHASAPATSVPQETPVPTSVVPSSVANAAPGAVDDDRSLAPLLVGVTGATALATGLLVTYRRLRQRQTAAGARAARKRKMSSRVANVERALVAAAELPLVAWAAHELHTLLTNLAVATDVRGTPLVVELSESDGIEILWTEPNERAASPWAATGDGWTWHLPYDPARHVPAERGAAPLPGLVTVGTRAGRQVLVDVEALGSLAVVGDLTRAADLARAVAFELATGDVLANSFVHTVEFDLPASEQLGKVTTRDAASAIQHVRGTVELVEAVLAEGEVADTFRLRAIGGPEGRELTVVVAGSTVAVDDVTDLLGKLVPHRGAAAIVVGDHPGARARLAIGPDGTATLDPPGLEFEAVGLPTDTAKMIEEALDDATESPTIAPIEPEAESASAAVTSNGDGHLDTATIAPESESLGEDDERELPHPELLVRVLGPPRVDGADRLPPMDVNILAFLACRRASATADQIINAVWNGRAVGMPTFWNHITKIRSVIGTQMPARAQGDQIGLADEVMSDLGILEACIAWAQEEASGRAIELLAHGLGLIEGVPFDLPGYDWAFDHQYHAQASAAVETAALRLVDLALKAGQPDVARCAIEQGLRALPANEPLYRARMRMEADAGNHAGVRQAYAELTRQLDDLSGGTGGFDPSDQTTTLLTKLAGR
jgi:DNA-binding SARP family transcriptional activator